MPGSLLDVVKKLPKGPNNAPRKGSTKADMDYVVPTSKEIEACVGDLAALGVLNLPRNYDFPYGGTKKALVAALEEIDPRGLVAERATLFRLLKAKGIKVDPTSSTTSELVHLAMVAGCFGRANKKRVTS
jgi:hypothetical protein